MEHGGDVDSLAGLMACVEQLLDPLCLLVLALCTLACVLLLVRRGVRREAFAGAGALALIALLPVAWLSLTCNHSVTHAFYTYRSLTVLVFALLCILVLFVVGLLKEGGVQIRESVAAWPLPLRWAFYLAALFSVIIFGIYGVGFDASSFAYMGF